MRGLHSPNLTPRTYVLVDLGTPVRGRRGYRGVGTIECAGRAEARAVARWCEWARESVGTTGGPIRPLTPRQAGLRLLLEALTEDGCDWAGLA